MEALSHFNAGLRASHSWGERVALVSGVCCATSACLYTLKRRGLTPSYASLLVVLPVLVVNAWLPTVFAARSELMSRVILGLLTAWLGNFKAVGLCLNRGPLVSSDWTLPQFTLLYVMPVYPRQEGPVKKGRLTDSAGSFGKLMMLAAGHAVALAGFAYMLATVPLPTAIRQYCYMLGLASFVSFIMNGPAAVLIALAELDVVPPFDRPWLATSLIDFWGRRWNNTVGLTLRSLMYDPVVEGCLMHHSPHAPTQAAAAAAAAAGGSVAPAAQRSGSSKGSAAKAAAPRPPRVSLAKRLVGSAATFGASGVMHEFILMYALHEGNTYRGGYWFMFFFVQFPLLVAEDMLRKRLRGRGPKVPALLHWGYTTALLMTSAYLFWFPPVEQHTDVAARVLESVNGGAAVALARLQALVQQLGLGDVAAQVAAAVSGSVSHVA